MWGNLDLNQGPAGMSLQTQDPGSIDHVVKKADIKRKGQSRLPLIEHKAYMTKYGEDLPEIRDRKWPAESK
jgi:hypothetical protein